jgi:hypothetical protein
MSVFWIRFRRYLWRKVPRHWWNTFRQPLASSGQLFQAILAYLVLVLYLRVASPQQRDLLATEWAIWIQAFGIAVAGWAVISLVYAPYAAWRTDARNGRWYGKRFLYHQPQLIAVERCAATGQMERFKIRFDDAEPHSFVHFHIDLDHPLIAKRIFAAVFTSVWMRGQYGNSHLRGGTRLPADRSAYLAVDMMPKTVSQTIRVYMDGFSIGNPEDVDGLPNRPEKTGNLT